MYDCLQFLLLDIFYALFSSCFRRRSITNFLCFTQLMLCYPLSSVAAKKDDPLAAWKPKFDPAGAKYTYLLSTVTHPTINGVSVGYTIHDKVWEKTGGKIYVDFRPLGQLGVG